jgi:hypothetical protein
MAMGTDAESRDGEIATGIATGRLNTDREKG